MKHRTAARVAIGLAALALVLTLIFLYLIYLTDSGDTGAMGPLAIAFAVLLGALIVWLSRRLARSSTSVGQRLRNLRLVLLATLFAMVGSIAWLLVFIFGDVPDAQVKQGRVIGVVAIVFSGTAIAVVRRLGGPQLTAADPATEPAWWIRDIIVATCLGALFFTAQLVFDNRRSDREAQLADDAQQEQEQLDQLQFVLDRSGSGPLDRPFYGFSFSNGSLSGLALSGADLREAGLEGMAVVDTVLAEADLRGVFVWRSRFAGSNLSGADFGCLSDEMSRIRHCADVLQSTFFAVDLSDAIFTGARIENVEFDPSSVLDGADFRGATLRGVRLDGVDLSNAALDATTDLSGVCFDSRTQWPDGFAPPADRSESCTVLS